MKTELKDRCARIEEAYEFMLAYAAQGLRTEPGSGSGSQIRAMLTVCSNSLTGLADLFTQIARTDKLEPAAAYDNFITVLARDATDAQASIQLALAQPSISSQISTAGADSRIETQARNRLGLEPAQTTEFIDLAPAGR